MCAVCVTVSLSFHSKHREKLNGRCGRGAGLFLHAEDDASPTVSSTQSDVGKQVMRTVPWWVLPWTYAALELVTLFTAKQRSLDS